VIQFIQRSKQSNFANPLQKGTKMTNAQINKAFLAATDAKTRTAILANIANHYGIGLLDAYEEVTDAEAEHLLDYVTGAQRIATSAIMQRHAFA
jgi:hypothetical protein